jgi:hypothetical protein
MSERPRSDLANRLRLVDSLLTAAGDNLSSLQRLLTEVRTEVELARREEEEASRDEEIRALRREVDQLREGMASRAVIERAKGILMQGRTISEARAFELLNELSQRSHRKLRDVAADVVSGTLGLPVPATAPEDGSPAGGALGNGTRSGPVDPALTRR